MTTLSRPAAIDPATENPGIEESAGSGGPLKGRRICIVTSGPIGSNPRVVKEADALVEAGARVTVVSLDATGLAHVQARNEAVLAAASWSCVLLRRGPFLPHLLRSVGHKLALVAARWGALAFPVVVHALDRHSWRLARAASKVEADLFIAHNLGALPAARWAAQRQGALLGFDAEDFHAGQLPPGPEWDFQRRLITLVEGRCLPDCHWVSAASPGIARAYAERYDLPEPCTLLNVFPLSEAPAQASEQGRAEAGPSLYWFSQTVGPDRGLEDAVKALGMLTRPLHLYLRGSISPGYRDSLLSIASDAGVESRVHFLEPALPAEMARLASVHDIGLALETMETPNRQIALTNKVFTYLLAGLPQVASATPGQAELAPELLGAAWFYPPGDVEALARLLGERLDRPEELRAARRIAFAYGQGRFNWDVESRRLVDGIRKVFLRGGAAEGA